MALTDGTYVARLKLNHLDQPYLPGTVVPGTAFENEAQVVEYIRRGWIDVGSPEGGGGLPQVTAIPSGGSFASSKGSSVVSGEVGAAYWADPEDILSYSPFDSQIKSDGIASFVNGHAGSGDGGQAVLEATEDAVGASLFGYAYGGAPGASAIVRTGKSGSAAFGSASTWAVDGKATIESIGNGSVAFGRAQRNGRISSTNQGTFAGGFAYGSTTEIAAIEATSAGSFATGKANGSSTIQATAVGAFAQGYASDGTISATGVGASAQGYARGTTTGVVSVSSTTYGSMAFGYVTNYGSSGDATILAGDVGSFAGGLVFGSDGGVGSIKANGPGSIAFGSAQNFSIESIGRGSMAFGHAANANIVASAHNSQQFGPGTNAQADSLSVGVGPRFKGTVGAPASPRNGDIWVEASGAVMVRTEGVSKSLSGLA